VFPVDLKKAEVTPIYKKKYQLNKKNYRPVSVLPTFAKILEQQMADQLQSYFNNIFDANVAAYRKGYSCQNVLLNLLDKWKIALDNKNYVGALFMDLSKCFDSMPHALLISKLYAYGLSVNACQLIADYLTNRKQRTKLGINKSLWADIMKGFPQGSGLGPFLFNVFINDLFFFIRVCTLCNYADDNTITTCDADQKVVESSIKVDAENAINWFNSNMMQANPNKFQVMFLCPLRTADPFTDTFTFSNIEIQRQHSAKLLGVIIDDKLNFNDHIRTICIKAARQLNALSRIKSYISVNQRQLLYQSFILSNFNFCPIVWHFCSTKNTQKIEKIQKRALRFLFDDNESSYETLLSLSGIKTLFLRRIQLFAIEVYKSINGYNPVFMTSMFSIKRVQYDFRDNFKLTVPHFNNVTHGQRSFRYYGAHVWNDVPAEIKAAENIGVFKRLIKLWNGPSCQCNMCNVLR
jgi:hypothetical protein